MYKIIYCDKIDDKNTLENIHSLIIDVSDINNMKYVDIICKGDIYLLILYVKCLKYYHTKLKLNERFSINNNFEENKNIIQAVLNCKWLINEDDVINNLDILEEIKSEYEEEIMLLNGTKALKDIHRIYLMQYFVKSLKQAKKNIGIEKEKVKKYSDDGR